MDSSFDSPSEVCSSVFSVSSSAFASSAGGSSDFASTSAVSYKFYSNYNITGFIIIAQNCLFK